MTTSMITRPMADRLDKAQAKLNSSLSEFQANLKSTLGQNFSFNKDKDVKLVSKGGTSYGTVMDKELKDATDSFKNHYKT